MIGLASMPYRFVRATLLTTSVFSFLLWVYLVLRIVVNHASFDSTFIDAFLPWFTFYRLGVISFVVSAGSLLLYLTIFWKGGAR
jgi:hypothetical protein